MATTGTPRIPELWPEILENIVKQGKGKWSAADLRNLRLASPAFASASKYLFDRAYFSITSDNIEAFNGINNKFGKRIQTLYLDAAVFQSYNTMATFAAEAATQYHSFLCPGARHAQLDSHPLSMKNIALALTKPTSSDPPDTMLPRDLRSKLMEAYTLNQAYFEYQAAFFKTDNAVHQLTALLTNARHIHTIEAYTWWSPTAGDALQDLLESTLPEAAIGKLCPTEDPQYKADKALAVAAGLTHNGQSFDAPGPSARGWHPLQIAPFQPTTTPNQRSGAQELYMVQSLIAALGRSKVNTLQRLRIPAEAFLTLSETGIDEENDDREPIVSQNLGVSVNCLITFPRKHTTNMNPLAAAFKSLKTLELQLHTVGIGLTDRRTHRVVNEWFPNAIRGMRSIENLQLSFEDKPGADVTFDMFKLLLDRQYDNDRFTCHLDDPDVQKKWSVPGSVGAWVPTRDVPIQGGANYNVLDDNFLPIRALSPHPWPSLKRLVLHNIRATKQDLTTFFLTVGPTLDYLWLEDIDVGRCPCSGGTRSGWNDNWIMCWQDGYGSDSAWYDTLTVLGKTLKRPRNSEHYNIQFPNRARHQLVAKLHMMLGVTGRFLDSMGELKDYILAYLDDDCSVGFALFLVHSCEIEDTKFVDESWKLKWEQWKEQLPLRSIILA